MKVWIVCKDMKFPESEADIFAIYTTPVELKHYPDHMILETEISLEHLFP